MREKRSIQTFIRIFQTIIQITISIFDRNPIKIITKPKSNSICQNLKIYQQL